jgi:hypothetical protein
MREKCPNFEICGRYRDHPDTIVCTYLCYYKYNGVCLDFVNSVECPVCLEVVRCVYFPGCSHFACVLSCFHRLERCPVCRHDPLYFSHLFLVL